MARLLIVDDELSMRQFLTHLFQRDGHAIRVAENGRQAMAMLREQPADVIISDVKMPDMGGIDLLRAARELQPEIEVIMMTAFANEQTAHEAFLLGAFDFVHKPFDNNLLFTNRAGLADLSQSLVLSDTYSFSPTVLNSLHVTGTKIRVNRYPQSDFINPATVGINIAALAPNFLYFSIAGYFNSGCGSCAPAVYTDGQGQIADDVDVNYLMHCQRPV